MRKDKRESYPGIQIGISFLLVVFIILCLVIFATLSLSGAVRDREYSLKAVRRTTDYYKACSQAQETVGDIDALLSDAGQHADNNEDYLGYVTTQLKQYPELAIHTDGSTSITFSESINDRQTLEVALELEEYPLTGDDAYRIVKWKEAAAKGWESKTSLPVLGSDGGK